MFKFNFSDLGLEDEIDKPPPETDFAMHTPASLHPNGQCNRHSHMETSPGVRQLVLDELAQALPPAFSYSPLVVPLSHAAVSSHAPTAESHESVTSKDDPSSRKTASFPPSVTLLRRDLFDARYQLISEADGDEPSAGSIPSAVQLEPPAPSSPDSLLKFVDNPSDLVPGVYEGGLKTWECCLDLVDYLAGFVSDKGESEDVNWVKGKRIFEVGCGTAIPSLFLLHSLFSRPRRTSTSGVGSNAEPNQTEFVLQDYNELVLRLVTFPNVLLTWYASPLAETYRLQYPTEDENGDCKAFDPSQPGDLQITTELLTAFRSSMDEQRISLRFIAGPWHCLTSNSANDGLCTLPFDITLTSETIYQTSSLSSLIVLLKRCTSQSEGCSGPEIDSNDEIVPRPNGRLLKGSGGGRLCLVAAKVLYFGVGGGVMDFERAINDAGGKTFTVLERKAGVGRKVLSIEWV